MRSARSNWTHFEMLSGLKRDPLLFVWQMQIKQADNSLVIWRIKLKIASATVHKNCFFVPLCKAVPSSVLSSQFIDAIFSADSFDHLESRTRIICHRWRGRGLAAPRCRAPRIVSSDLLIFADWRSASFAPTLYFILTPKACALNPPPPSQFAALDPVVPGTSRAPKQKFGKS